MASSSTNDRCDLVDADKILQIYLHDYMIKRGLHNTAEVFKNEAQVSNSPPDMKFLDSVLDSPDGFLHEWWSIFYEVFSSRQGRHWGTEPESSTEVVPKITDIPRNGAAFRIPQIPMNEQRPQQFQASSSFNNMMPQIPAACLIPSTLYNKENLGYLAKNVEPSLLDLIKATNPEFFVGTSSKHPPQDLGKLAQKQVFNDNGINMRVGRNVPRDPLDALQKTMLPLDGPRETKNNEAPNLVPVNGWPLNVGDVNQVLTSLLPSPNEAAALTQAPACTPQSQTFTAPGNSTRYSNQYPNIPQTESSQIIRIGEPQCKQDQQMQMQSQNVEKSRKRKIATSLRPEESVGDCVDAADGKPVDENVESFLSIEDEHVDHRVVPFSNLKRVSATNSRKNKGFSFEEVGCLHSSKSKVLSSHFSSDGKVLASAGHEKKVFIWNMGTFDCVTTAETHSHLITDVRFRPGSTIFATSSFDRSVRLWDTTRPARSLFKLTGHAEQVMSLDFHPRKTDLLCSCDNNDIIRLWNVNQCVCMHITKGGSKQVRFQPHYGKFLATATGNNIKIIDVETDSLLCHLKGHVKDVLSICWDRSGNYVASVSEDSARVWSDGKCINELHSNGNKFQSCIFHPAYVNLLIIGGYQSLELWSPTESSKTWTVPAHKGLIAGLADSPKDELIASTSHDHCVKIWK